MKLKISLLFIFICFVSCGQSDISFDKAKKLNDEQKFEEAIEILNIIIKKDPNYDSAYWERSYAYSMLWDKERALNDYQHLIGVPSMKLDALFNRGHLYFTIGDYQKAIDDFSKIIEINPTDFMAYRWRGEFYTYLEIPGPDENNNYSTNIESGFKFHHDYDKALKDYNKSIKLKPTCVECLLCRGNIYMTQELYDFSLQDYNNAILIDNTQSNSYFLRALLYKTLEKTTEALIDFAKAINLDPTNPYPYLNRGYLYRETNNKSSACKDFNKAEELGYELQQDEKNYCK